MAQLNFPASSDGEFAQINLASSDDGVSEASTIYDPAAFEHDPKYTEQKAQADAEKKRLAEMGVVDGPNGAAIDIATSVGSPHPGKNPFREEDEEQVLVDESPVCCCGLISLKLAVIVTNVLLALLGVVALIVGITDFAKGVRNSAEGFDALDAILLSGPFYINVACCITGVLLAAVGAMGLVLCPEIVFGRAERGRKLLFLVYQSLLLLAAIVFTLLTILNAVAIVKVKSKDMYDSGHWIGTIQKQPKHVCDIEALFKCAGFNALDQCSVPLSVTANKHCPGHFCTDFCRIGGNHSENLVPGCDVCRDGHDYVACKESESKYSPTLSCQKPLNDSISSSYNDSLLILILILLGSILALCVAGFRGCCMPNVVD